MEKQGFVATPIAAFCTLHKNCVAGIMVTASHNPKEDAGYKVYKPFLKTNNENRIIDNIVKNFDKKNTEIIIIGNSIRYKLYDFKIPKN